MQNGFLKPLIPVTLAILTVSLVFVIISQRETTPTYTVDTVSSVCLSEPHDIGIVAEGNSITITAPLITPNPCYSASAAVNFAGKEIDIEFVSLPKQGVCVQCIGEVTGKIVIQNLTKGNYGVEVKTPDKAAITTIMIE